MDFFELPTKFHWEEKKSLISVLMNIAYSLYVWYWLQISLLFYLQLLFCQLTWLQKQLGS